MLIPWLGGPEAQRPRLLVVDSDRAYAQAAARIMRTVEVEVEVANSIPAAIRTIASKPPRLVLFDGLILYTDAPTAVAQLRTSLPIPSTPIVLCSALDEAQLAPWVTVCKADGYISKSVGPVELRKRVLEWLVTRPLTPISGLRPVS